MESFASERYRSLEALASPAAYVDRAGAILFSNEAFDTLRRELLGDVPDGNALSGLIVPDDREQVSEILAGNGARVRRPVRSVAAASTGGRLAVDFAPIRRRLHSGLVWLVTLRPAGAPRISSELAAKAALTERYIDDLRAPVQDVLGWASLLRRSRDEPERVEQALETIERNAATLMVLLQNLIEQARPAETGHAAAGDSSQVV